MTDEPIAWDYETTNGPPLVTPDLITADPEFLLRCALTFNWSALLQFCGILHDVLTSAGVHPDSAHAENVDATATSDAYDATATATDQNARTATPTERRRYIYANDRFAESISDYNDPILLRERQAKQRLSAARSQLAQCDQWGNTPLHAACYNHPPLAVVKAILECASVASPPVQLHTFLAMDLSTPLSIACATGATARIIRALLVGEQQQQCQHHRRQQQSSPITACRSASKLAHGGSVVCAPDARGCTPLTELVVQYELERQAPQWRRLNAPSLDQVGSFHSDSEFHLLLDEFWSKVQLLLRAAWDYDASQNVFDFRPGDASTDSQYDTYHIHDSNIHSKPGDERTQQAQSGDVLATRETAKSWVSYLHAAANICHAIPPVLAHAICRSFPSEVSDDACLGRNAATVSSVCSPATPPTATVSEQYTPSVLYLAISSLHKTVCVPFEETLQTVRPEPCSDLSRSSFRDRQGEFVRTLVELNPRCARQTVPVSIHHRKAGTEGMELCEIRHRTMLCFAIVHGLQWHVWESGCLASPGNGSCSNVYTVSPLSEWSFPPVDAVNDEDGSALSSLALAGPLQCLYRAYPDALMMRDPVTGLYPFVLAAVVRRDDGMLSRRHRKERVESVCDEEDPASLLQLDTVYNLMRLHPQLLSET